MTCFCTKNVFPWCSRGTASGEISVWTITVSETMKLYVSASDVKKKTWNALVLRSWMWGRKDIAGQTAHKQARCSIHHDQTKLPQAKRKQQEPENENKESKRLALCNNNKNIKSYIVFFSCRKRIILMSRKKLNWKHSQNMLKSIYILHKYTHWTASSLALF